jgi:hypothetical protein
MPFHEAEMREIFCANVRLPAAEFVQLQLEQPPHFTSKICLPLWRRNCGSRDCVAFVNLGSDMISNVNREMRGKGGSLLDLTVSAVVTYMRSEGWALVTVVHEVDRPQPLWSYFGLIHSKAPVREVVNFVFTRA